MKYYSFLLPITGFPLVEDPSAIAAAGGHAIQTTPYIFHALQSDTMSRKEKKTHNKTREAGGTVRRHVEGCSSPLRCIDFCCTAAGGGSPRKDHCSLFPSTAIPDRPSTLGALLHHRLTPFSRCGTTMPSSFQCIRLSASVHPTQNGHRQRVYPHPPSTPTPFAPSDTADLLLFGGPNRKWVRSARPPLLLYTFRQCAKYPAIFMGGGGGGCPILLIVTQYPSKIPSHAGGL